MMEAFMSAAFGAFGDEIPEVPEETEGTTEAPQVKSNYGYQQNGYQRNNGGF